MIRECVNCGAALSGPTAAKRGPDTAWHLQCLECHKLVADQLDLVMDRPDGARIAIYRCTSCSTARSCRPGWRTRCHICLDERSAGPTVAHASATALAKLASLPGSEAQLKTLLADATGEEARARAIVQFELSTHLGLSG